MNAPTPLKLAMYLLDRFGSPYQRESLAGDLIEQLQNGRSSAWIWREILCAVLIGRLRAIESKPWQSSAKTIFRIINAIMLAAAIALGVGTLTHADSPQTTCVPEGGC
jgi:hypothetical protein